MADRPTTEQQAAPQIADACGEVGVSRLRVAFVSYSWGEICMRLTAALAETNDVLLITSEKQAAPHRQLLDPRVETCIQTLPRLRHVFGQLRAQWRAVQAIRRFKPDVVHLQHGHMWFNPLLWFLRKYPLVLTIHDPRHHLGDKSSQRTPQWLLDRGFRRADLIVVQASQMVRPMVEEVGIAERSIRLVPLVELGDRNLATDVVEDDDPTVLWFGRIWAYKGLHDLIRAQPKINELVPDARFIIAGQGEDFSPYRQAMADPERFEIHNDFVSNELRAELFRRCSLVVLPYLEATQSAVVINAYAYGKPVVATAVGGLRDQVDHQRTGLLVPPADFDALADAVVELLLDDDRRRRYGKAGLDKLETEWSAPRIAEQTLEVYRQAIDARSNS